MKYHLKFGNIHSRTVEHTKTLLTGWSSLSAHEQWLALDKWVGEVTEVYGMMRPVLTVDPEAGAGYYLIRRNEIVMSKPSIVTLLHEFRHAMQRQGKAGRQFRGVEDDARAWSLSLYWLVAPRLLKRLVAEGKILHTTPADFG